MEKFHSSIMPADTSVAKVMMASNSASEPDAISASLFSCVPLRFTNSPSTIFTAMATTMTTSVAVV